MLDANGISQITFVLLDASLKSAAVLTAAVIVTMLMRHSSAAARRAVIATAAASIILMPALSIIRPTWSVLPNCVSPHPQVSQPLEVTPAVSAPLDDITTAPMTGGAGGTGETVAMQTDEPFRPANPAVNQDGRGLALPPAAATASAIPWPGWLLLAWALGAAITCLPLLLGHVSLWRLGRRSTPITDGPWMLLRSKQRAMPMTWGLASSRLLLPAEADAWEPQRRRVVLLHELAHVKRHDCLTQLLMQIVCALYWFNPLAWWAFKLMQIERERACDDMVLMLGRTGGAGTTGGSDTRIKPSTYAEQLLGIASGLQSPLLTGYTAIAMVRPSTFEQRLLAILDTNRNRRAVTRVALLATVILLAGIVVPVAMLRGQSDIAKAQEPAAKEARWAAKARHRKPTWREMRRAARLRRTQTLI
jgi:hypothetical protein